MIDITKIGLTNKQKITKTRHDEESCFLANHQFEPYDSYSWFLKTIIR